MRRASRRAQGEVGAQGRRLHDRSLRQVLQGLDSFLRTKGVGDCGGGGAELLRGVRAHDRDSEARRAARDGRIAYGRDEETARLKSGARVKGFFFVADDDRNDRRLAACGNAAPRKLRDEERHVLAKTRYPFWLCDEDFKRGESGRHRGRARRR